MEAASFSPLRLVAALPRYKTPGNDRYISHGVKRQNTTIPAITRFSQWPATEEDSVGGWIECIHPEGHTYFIHRDERLIMGPHDRSNLVKVNYLASLNTCRDQPDYVPEDVISDVGSARTSQFGSSPPISNVPRSVRPRARYKDHYLSRGVPLDITEPRHSIRGLSYQNQHPQLLDEASQSRLNDIVLNLDPPLFFSRIVAGESPSAPKPPDSRSYSFSQQRIVNSDEDNPQQVNSIELESLPGTERAGRSAAVTGASTPHENRQETSQDTSAGSQRVGNDAAGAFVSVSRSNTRQLEDSLERGVIGAQLEAETELWPWLDLAVLSPRTKWIITLVVLGIVLVGAISKLVQTILSSTSSH